MAKHTHGEMDTKVQEDTFAGFIGFATKSIYVIIAVLVFLAIFNS
jgi:hypothetical protein